MELGPQEAHRGQIWGRQIGLESAQPGRGQSMSVYLGPESTKFKSSSPDGSALGCATARPVQLAFHAHQHGPNLVEPSPSFVNTGPNLIENPRSPLWSKSAQIWWTSVKLAECGPSLVEICQTCSISAKIGRSRLKVGQNPPEVGRHGPSLSEIGSNAKVGRNRPCVTEVDRSRPNLSKAGPTCAKSGQDRPN